MSEYDANLTPLQKCAVSAMRNALNDIAQFFDGDYPLFPSAQISDNDDSIKENINAALQHAFRAFGSSK